MTGPRGERRERRPTLVAPEPGGAGCARSLDPAADPRRVRRPAPAARQSARLHRGGEEPRARRSTTCCSSGPPGLGKTTLAQIVARELGVGFRATSGPVIQRAGDLAALLTNLQPRDILFIDEIHRLTPAVEEILYPAMEDFQLDLIIGEGPGARSVRIDLPPFTLVGATTRSGLITRPLRERFGIPLRLVFYEPAELALIVARGARVLGIRRWSPTAPPRSPAAPAARRASRCACCAASATSPRCKAGRIDRRRGRRRGAAAARGRCPRPRRHGPALSALHRRELRRRPGRGRDHGGGARRAARRASRR